MRSVVHFEIPVDDLERAKRFYRTVFEWEANSMDMPGGGQYTEAVTTPVDDQRQPTTPGAINGGLVARATDTPVPVLTIDVGSIDDALEQVEANGGQTVTPRTAISGMGAYAYFRDSEGNIVGLWETTDS
jgi:predicted enzyme related to lactoylglutathione lyase